MMQHTLKRSDKRATTWSRDDRAQVQRNTLFNCRQLRVIALVRAGRQKARALLSSMACFSAESCIVEMRAFQIIEECIQFACIHVVDVVPPPEALHDDAIAHGRRGLILEKGCLGLGYGNGLVISHTTTLARRDYPVDALVNTPKEDEVVWQAHLALRPCVDT